MGKWRMISAWVAAIVAFFVVHLVAGALGAKVGVPVSLEVTPYWVSYGRGAEEERDAITTTFGWGVILLSILAAMATWHFVQATPITRHGRADFLAFLLGSVFLIVGGVLLWKTFSSSDGLTAILGNLLEVGLLGGAIFAGVKLASHLKTGPRNT